MDDPIEGVDYIFDRYSFLGIVYNSSLDTIKTKIRKKRAENHPDKLLRVSEEIQQLAKRQLELVDQCERVLCNEEIKLLYDNKLQDFIKYEPDLVSNNGNYIISLSKFKVNLNYLLGNEIHNYSDLENKAMQMSGYNQKKLERLIVKYSKNKDVDNGEDLREMLINKLVYLNVIEEYYWNKAGINGGVQPDENFRTQHAEDIVENFKKKIQDIEKKAEQALNDRNGAALLGFTKPLLLGNNNEEVSTKLILNQVIKSFQMRTADLQKLIEDKKITIEQLCEVSRVKKMNETTSPIYNILLVQVDSLENDFDNKNFLGMGFKFDKVNNQVTSYSIDNVSFISSEENIWLIEPNPEIMAPLIEVMALIKTIEKG